MGLLKQQWIDKDQLQQYRQQALLHIQRAQNIFVDLNDQNRLFIKLRFFLPLVYLEKELEHYQFLQHPNPEDLSVVDLGLTFFWI